jgi:hypothetical protein
MKINKYLLITLIFENLYFPAVILAQSNIEKRDQQKIEASKFVHLGVKDKVLKEKCKEINDCEIEEMFPIENLIGQAYGLIGLIGGGESAKLNKVPSVEQKLDASKKSTDTHKVKPEKDNFTDYCMMIATTYEVIGAQIQNALQRQSDQSVAKDDAQLQALINLQQTHNARKKTARIQSYTYGAVSTCYTSMLFRPDVAKDANLILKISASAALTGLYIKKSVNHKKASEKVGEVIAAMEFAGKDCNPWTKSSCFCKEPSSKQIYPYHFEEVCVLNKGNFEGTKVAVGCSAVNGSNVSYDKDCKCKTTNTCFKNNLRFMGPQLGTGASLVNEANNTLDQITGGEFDMGELDKKSIEQAKMASRIKINGTDKIKAPELTEKQKMISNELEKYMPKNIAQIAAAVKPASLSGINEISRGLSAINNLPEKIKEKLADAISVDYKQAESPKTYSDEELEFSLPKMDNLNETSDTQSAEIMDFAEEATRKAEISNTKGTPIFDIISNRYRQSAWKKLDAKEL